jgi:transposase
VWPRSGLIEVITTMSDAIDALKAELAAVFDQHTQAPAITSFPGLGPVLGARILGELGDDPHRSPMHAACAVSLALPPSPAPPGEAVWYRHDESATGASRR